MDTLAKICAELQRQADRARASGLGCYDDSNPRNALLDGRVDLVDLANAIDGAWLPRTEARSAAMEDRRSGRS